ncbi:MAG: hypothetical protein ACQETJ_10620 [Bacteroidota bacterium]
MKKILGFMVAASLIFATSCQEERLEEQTLSEGQTAARLSLKASTQPQATSLKSASVLFDTMIIDEAFIGVEKIKFKPLVDHKELKEQNRNQENQKIIFKGPYEINLLTGESYPEINWLEVYPGVYKEIELETENLLEGGNSIFIKGSVIVEELEIPFEFSTRKEFEMEIENDTGIVIDEGVLNDVMVMFNLPQMFDVIDFDDVPEFEFNEEGVLIFSDESNEEITDLMREMMEEVGIFLKLKPEGHAYGKYKDKHDDDDDDDDDDNDDDDHDDEDDD